MDKSITVPLAKAANRSTHKRYQVGALIVRRGEIVSDGCAHSSSHRLTELESIHAEIHALARGRHLDLRGATAYVLTLARKSGNATLALPCLTCAIALRGAGIKRVFYSTQAGFKELDLDDDLSHLRIYRKRGENE